VKERELIITQAEIAHNVQKVLFGYDNVVLHGSHNGFVIPIAETTGNCFLGADDEEDAQHKTANFFNMDGFDH
ncbi:MAG: hypothetical protein KJ687_06765, partial [Proteobacteria bacterium]|nr:hypothetical protein [Pseudomonadota bacterium]